MNETFLRTLCFIIDRSCLIAVSIRFDIGYWICCVLCCMLLDCFSLYFLFFLFSFVWLPVNVFSIHALINSINMMRLFCSVSLSHTAHTKHQDQHIHNVVEWKSMINRNEQFLEMNSWNGRSNVPSSERQEKNCLLLLYFLFFFILFFFGFSFIGKRLRILCIEQDGSNSYYSNRTCQENKTLQENDYSERMKEKNKTKKEQQTFPHRSTAIAF